MKNPAVVDARAVVRQWLNEAMQCGSLDAYQAKRRSLRVRWDRPLELQIDGELIYVHARDVSEAGVGLCIRRRLARNQQVLVRRQEGQPWIPCRVVHVTPSVGSLKMGVELEFDFSE